MLFIRSRIILVSSALSPYTDTAFSIAEMAYFEAFSVSSVSVYASAIQGYNNDFKTSEPSSACVLKRLTSMEADSDGIPLFSISTKPCMNDCQMKTYGLFFDFET